MRETRENLIRESDAWSRQNGALERSEMKVKVFYIDFHWSNYQGGVGTSFEMSVVIDIPASVLAGEIKQLIADSVQKAAEAARPFTQHEKATIVQIEIV